MILSADGKDLTVPGKNLKVSVSLQLVRKDLSGMTSGTATVTGGNKPQVVSVSTTIPTSGKTDLYNLKTAAEALDKAGDPVTYTIVDATSEAMGIRQVKFCDTMSVKENDGLRAWDVSFTLQEVRSAAEKKEERSKDKEVKATKASGEEVAPAEDQTPKGTFEKLLGFVEQAIP